MKYLAIVLEYPDNVILRDIKDYAQEALQVWGGQRQPGSELFYTTKARKKNMKQVHKEPSR